MALLRDAVQETVKIFLLRKATMRARYAKGLVCPKTLRPLRLHAHHQEGDHVLEGELVAEGEPTCRYPIRRGVPRFVQREAMGDGQRETVESFSYKWERIPQYAFAEATKSNRERWYFDRFGFAQGEADVREFLGAAT